MSLSRVSPRDHILMPLGAREVMYKSETDWVQYKTQWWHWGHLDSKCPTCSCCPAPATRCLEGMPVSHSQVHDFSKTVWKFRYLCKYPVCKCWQLMLFSFLLNTMQPSSLGRHFVTSTLGILREEVRCATVCFYPFHLRNFTSLLSHTRGCLEKHHPSTGRAWVWGKWKVGPLKAQIQPLPSCLWIDP